MLRSATWSQLEPRAKASAENPSTGTLVIHHSRSSEEQSTVSLYCCCCWQAEGMTT